MKSDTKKTSTPNKIDWSSLFVTEFTLYAFQVVCIFLVAFFISDSFSNETRLSDFVSSRLHASSVQEIGWTFLATFVCFGLIFVAEMLFYNNLLKSIASELIYELPRTIYLFGSSFTAITFSMAVYFSKYPAARGLIKTNFYYSSAFIGFMFFFYGFCLKALVHHRRIKLQSIEQNDRNPSKK